MNRILKIGLNNNFFLILFKKLSFKYHFIQIFKKSCKTEEIFTKFVKLESI